MFEKDFDPLLDLQKCQLELIRQSRIIDRLCKSNQEMCIMAKDLIDEYEKLKKEVAKNRRDIGTIKILTLDK